MSTKTGSSRGSREYSDGRAGCGEDGGGGKAGQVRVTRKKKRASEDGDPRISRDDQGMPRAEEVARKMKRDFLAGRDVATTKREWRGVLSVLAGMTPREIEQAVARA